MEYIVLIEHVNGEKEYEEFNSKSDAKAFYKRQCCEENDIESCTFVKGKPIEQWINPALFDGD